MKSFIRSSYNIALWVRDYGNCRYLCCNKVSVSSDFQLSVGKTLGEMLISCPVVRPSKVQGSSHVLYQSGISTPITNSGSAPLADKPALKSASVATSNSNTDYPYPLAWIHTTSGPQKKSILQHRHFERRYNIKSYFCEPFRSG